MTSSSTKSLAAVSFAAASLFSWPAAADLSNIETLGKFIFYDTSLSIPSNKQGCISCHEPAQGGILPNSTINATTVVAPGADPHARGNIRPPTNEYASFSPVFHSLPVLPPLVPWQGGNFWDGRAEGCGALHASSLSGRCQIGPVGATSDTIYQEVLPTNFVSIYKGFLGPTADQALNPFPNNVEQNTREKAVCQQVKTAKYKALYQQAFSEFIDCTSGLETSYKRIAVALAAYQASSDVNSFSSKRDKALAADADGQFPLDGFNTHENRGHDLFYNKTSSLNPDGKHANCVFCHHGVPTNSGSPDRGVDPGADPNGTDLHQLYTDEGYHNIGTPCNTAIPGVACGDKTGLKAHVPSAEVGAFKTPTLRNVDKRTNPGFTKAYTHNGWFKSLTNLVHFYNTRDDRSKVPLCSNPQATEKQTQPGPDGRSTCWPASEFDETKVTFIIGKLNLLPEDEDDIVAYLKTLSDDHTATPPSSAKKGAR